MKTPVLFICLFIFSQFNVLGQAAMHQVINSTGGTFEKGNATYEWSIGEMALVNEMQSSNGKYVLSNGFLQSSSHSNSNNNNSKEKIFTEGEIQILSNPTKDKLRIHFLLSQKGRLKILMYDDLGYTLYKKKLP